MSQLQKDEQVLLKLFKDKRFVTATLGLIVLVASSFVPSLVAYEPIIMVGLFALIAVLVHGFTLSDVQGAGSNVPLTLSDALVAEIQALVAALQSNTNTTAVNTSVIASKTTDATKSNG